MECPGCGERIYRQELIDGECPLCGVSVERESEYDDALDEIADLFDPSSETMAVNVDQERDVRRRLVLHVEPTLLDRVRPKRCSACGRWHLRFGDKEYRVVVEGDEGHIERGYICSICTA
ncbi:MAG: hypothetical protein ACLFMT_01965 [Halobacteriales archaeon]